MARESRLFSEEFKREAVKLVGQPGPSKAGIARDLCVGANLLGRWRREANVNGQAGGGEKVCVSIHSIYAWTKRHGVPAAERKAQDVQSDEMRRLKSELKRVTEERDILKKAAVYFAKTSG